MNVKTDKTLLFVGGCAGSFPVPSENRARWDPTVPGGIRWEPFNRHEYGGRTTCFLLRHRDTLILVDHGLGVDPASALLLDMFRQEPDLKREVSTCQTHYHLDHVQGTPQNKLLYTPNMLVRYHSPDLSPFRSVPSEGSAKAFSGMEHAMNAYFGPHGYWYPVTLAQLPSKQEHVQFTVGHTFRIDDVRVHTTGLTHKGGSCGYRFECGDRVVVVATDHEPRLDPDPVLAEFYDGADLLLVDMQYDREELLGEKPIGGMKMSRVGWGHGTPESVFPTILACRRRPKMVRIVHHDPLKSDTDLRLFCAHSTDVLRQLTGADTLPFDYQFAKGGDAYWL